MGAPELTQTPEALQMRLQRVWQVFQQEETSVEALKHTQASAPVQM